MKKIIYVLIFIIMQNMAYSASNYIQFAECKFNEINKASISVSLFFDSYQTSKGLMIATLDKNQNTIIRQSVNDVQVFFKDSNKISVNLPSVFPFEISLDNSYMTFSNKNKQVLEMRNGILRCIGTF